MVFQKSKNHAAPFWLSHEIANKIMVFFSTEKIVKYLTILVII